ncbi:glucose-1-phosphatase-like [Aricia agestis]|uniref:glucose-1-phosphatase-like n=1 Tax=Aricia agestis TaxID=91739 RepID=UPI001C205BE3|nr:glucose-1-phosphatase-like [Aricia agestis]
MTLKLALCLCLCVCGVHNLKLEQVLMFSRHNIRQPLTDNLQRFGADVPASKYKAGELTPKGAVLEKYMGEYLANWLHETDLLPRGCPDENVVYVYANTRQRTRKTAKAFVEGAFPSCNVVVYSIDSEQMDPIFNPIFRNTSQHTKEVIIGEMKSNLKKLNIKDSYVELDRMIDLTDAPICKEEHFCSFANTSDTIFYEIGKEPNLIGPLNYGNVMVDAYLMAYFDGMPMESIANGKLKNLERLELLGKITEANLVVRFYSPNLGREIAQPLLNYIYDALKTERKFILMMGHDANMQSLLAALEFKDFVLPEQIQSTPIGGKLVFQRWVDEDTNERFLKISYVYPTMKQIRDGVKLSVENPPRWVVVELNKCATSSNGLISWKCFMSLLENVK